jgi:hypothetical protein
MVVGDEAFCCVEDWVRNTEPARSKIVPNSPEKLTDPGRAIYTLCTASGDFELGEWISQAFGTTTCPNCTHTLDVASAIAASAYPH